MAKGGVTPGWCGHCRDTGSRRRQVQGRLPGIRPQTPAQPLGPLLSITHAWPPTCQHLLLLLGVLLATGQDRLQAKGQGARQDIPQAGPGWPMERWG